MPRYIDADTLKQRLLVGSELDSEPCKGFRSALLAMVDTQETADVVDKKLYDSMLENALIISEALNKYQTADVVERKDLDTITEAHEQIGYEKGYRDGYAQAKVEVVRCKECKHYGDDHFCCYPWCTDPEEFCSRGERREDG